MWSKQNETKTKNQGSSSKNKASNRKKKNDKTKSNQTNKRVDDITTNKANNKTTKTKQSQSQSEPQGIPKSKITPDLINVKVSIDEVDCLKDVTLRTKPRDIEDIESSKRFSDSIVIENVNQNDKPLGLSRARSGFFSSSERDKKTRRFSDIFRPTGSVSSNRTEGIDENMVTEFDIAENGRVITKNNNNKSTKPGKKVAQRNSQELTTNTTSNNNNNNSVLNRVRSKIYKHKSELYNSTLNIMPNINENKQENIKTSSNFDLRLIRQYSNLERITPLSQKKSQSEVPFQKPTLAKSKSSSAINLSILRSRRGKLTDMMKSSATPAKDEFEFIAFGNISNNISKSNNNTIIKSNNSSELIDVKTSNAVTRNPSDRRSEALKEESKLQDNSSTSRDADTSSGHNESTISLPASGSQKRRSHNSINRSESVKEQSEKNRKQRRNISDPLHSTGETVDLDQQHPFHHHSGSSSNSSLSSSFYRSLESPGSNTDALSDSDLEIEADPPDWKSTLTEEQLSKLQPDEMKRQDVINELFHTERSHVRNLKVLNQIFLKNIIESKALTDTEIKLVFPNLVELLTIHNQFNTIMKNKRKENVVVNEVGDILLGMFDGETGNNFCLAAAKFCENQQVALEFIKEKRKKDSKFAQVLSNCEKNNHCRRLPLQGFIPSEMQRLSKYPLLFERLIVVQDRLEGPNQSTEISKLRLTLDKSKEILNRVNEAAKLAYNKARLEDIKNHLDTVLFDRSEHKSLEEFKSFQNFDLSNYTLIHEGTVTLKRPNKTPIQVHMLLLEEAVILLQKESERFVLKFFHAGNQPLAPIIKIPNVICRTNAADVVTLFLLCNTQNSQMYEIQCRDSREREMWFRYLTEASEPYKIRDGKTRKAERNQDQEELEEDLDQISTEIETSNEPEMTSSSTNPEVDQDQDQDQNQTDEVATNEEESNKVDGDLNLNSCSTSDTGDSVTLKLTPNDWPLVQPSEVQVAVAPVHTAEPVLSNFEKIRRTDEEVIKALAKKEALVADYLNIPREHYQYIAEMASDEAVSKESLDREPSELVLGLIYQVDQLASLTNESLNISEVDSIVASGGKFPTCATNEALVRKNNPVPSVPAFKLQSIISALNPQLTSLMALVKHREEEKERLRKELCKLREQLHEKSNLHSSSVIDNEDTPVENVTDTKDLSNDKETQLE